MINGLEAVLPTGEKILTGSASASPHWFSRHPLPDFCGLFVDWKGTSGIVTKASIQLWPKQPFEDYYAVGIWDIDHVPAVLGRIVKAEITEEQSGRTREVVEVGFELFQVPPRMGTGPDDLVHQGPEAVHHRSETAAHRLQGSVPLRILQEEGRGQGRPGPHADLTGVGVEGSGDGQDDGVVGGGHGALLWWIPFNSRAKTGSGHVPRDPGPSSDPETHDPPPSPADPAGPGSLRPL